MSDNEEYKTVSDLLSEEVASDLSTSIKFKEATLEGWIRSLRSGEPLTVIRSSNAHGTFLHCKRTDEVFFVG